LPFFERKSRCTWKVEPTGNYSEDHETGEAYAIKFLRSCGGTIGWSKLLPQIVGDIIQAGQPNGVVIGFMPTIGNALNCAQMAGSPPFAC
jgi:hypothetical protein